MTAINYNHYSSETQYIFPEKVTINVYFVFKFSFSIFNKIHILIFNTHIVKKMTSKVEVSSARSNNIFKNGQNNFVAFHHF